MGRGANAGRGLRGVMRPELSGLNSYDVATMREIGIRELKARLSEILRAVGAGETIRVTNHGKPVADIVPPRKQSFEERMDELAAQGLVTRRKNRGPLPPAPPRVKLPPGAPSGSEQIIADREAERE